MASLNGEWSYRSFRGGANDTPPEILVPWAPPGELDVKTDDSGKVTGTLTFAPGVALAITGAVTSGDAARHIPEGVELTGEGLSAVYKVHGFFITGSDHIVGTVVAEKNDLARQADGTSGPFVLFPARSEPRQSKLTYLSGYAVRWFCNIAQRLRK